MSRIRNCRERRIVNRELLICDVDDSSLSGGGRTTIEYQVRAKMGRPVSRIRRDFSQLKISCNSDFRSEERARFAFSWRSIGGRRFAGISALSGRARKVGETDAGGEKDIVWEKLIRLPLRKRRTRKFR